MSGSVSEQPQGQVVDPSAMLAATQPRPQQAMMQGAIPPMMTFKPSGNPMKDIQAAANMKQQAMAPEIAGLQQAQQSGQANIAAARGRVESVPQTPAPTPQMTSALEAFGSPAVLFAMVASAFTHTPAIAAMNGAAAAINAIHQNDREKFEDGYRAWKDNTELALKRHQQQAEDYRMALEEYSTNVQARVAAIGAIGHVYDDQIMVQQALMHHWDAMAQMGNARSIAAMEIKARKDAVDTAFQHELTMFDLRKQAEQELRANTPQGAAMVKYQKQYPDGIPMDKLQQVAQLGHPLMMSANNQKFAGAQLIAQDEFRKAHEGREPNPDSQEDQVELTKLTFKAAMANSPIAGRAAVMTNRVITNAKDAISELQNVVAMPSSASTGWLSGITGGSPKFSVLESTKSVLANTLSSAEVRAYNESFVGMERSLGGLVTGGLQVNPQVLESFSKLAFKEGDTQFDKLRKLAIMKQNVQNGLEPILFSTIASEEQKNEIKDMLAQLDKAIPWAPNDVTHLQNLDNPQITLAEVARGKGLAGPRVTNAFPNAPAVGSVMKGHRYVGGDPSEQSSWEAVGGR